MNRIIGWIVAYIIVMIFMAPICYLLRIPYGWRLVTAVWLGIIMLKGLIRA